MVIFAHGFALQPAAGVGNPLFFLLQRSTTTGQMAVDGFFAISGFLVAGSLVKRGVIDYFVSRCLRVLPGLVICVFLTVFLLGPLITSLPLGEYFSHSRTYEYLNNAWALPFTVYKLPGVFESNHTSTVNGSLWSIPYEMRCYIALGLAGLFGLFRIRVISNILLCGAAILLWWSYIDPELLQLKQHRSSALLCFVIGVLFFNNRHKMILDIRLALLAIAGLYFSFGEPWYRYAYPLVWPYLLFYLAYRTRHWDLDKKVGDCSYGIYIYAFPVQQLAAYFMPNGTPYSNIVVTTLVVIPLVMLSWLYIEKPALRLKEKVMGTFQRRPN